MGETVNMLQVFSERTEVESEETNLMNLMPHAKWREGEPTK